MSNNDKQTANEQLWTVEQLEPKLLLSADLMPGVHEISGNIEKPGEQKQYEFVVTEKTKFFFDGVQGSKFDWSLKGKEFGQNFSTTQLERDSHIFLDLIPDTYELTIDGEDDQTGDYTFRMFGENTAISLNVNEQTELKLNPSSQAVLYKVQLNQGDRVFFESQTSNVTWSVFEPNTQLVKNRLNTADGFEATKTGTYWLSIEGNDSHNSLESQFILHSSQPDVIELNLNEKTTVNFNKPFQSTQYTFSLEQNQWIGFDQLSQGIENTEWQIKDSTGDTIFSNNSTNQKDTEIPPQFLKAGSYVLIINSLSIVHGEISFQLKSSMQVDAIVDENNKKLIINNGNESSFVKINSGNSDLLGLISEFNAINISNAKILNLEGISEKIFEANFSEQGIELYELALHQNDKIYLEKNREDTLIRIFNEKGEEVTKSESNDLEFSVLSSGFYYLGISFNQNNNYSLDNTNENNRTEKATIKVTYQPSVSVHYSNVDVGGSIYTAQKLDFKRTKKLEVVIGDNSSNYTDADFYRIQVNKGDVISVSASSGNGIDGYLKVFDKNGYVLTQTDNFLFSYQFNMEGEYYLAFSSSDNRYYSPYYENSGGYAWGKGKINVSIELNSPKLYLLDRNGNIIVDSSVNTLNVLQQKLNNNEEYYVWINSSLDSASYFSYTLGLSNKTKQQLELLESTKLDYEFDGVVQTHEVELNVTKAGTYIINPLKNNILNTSWRLDGPGIENIEWDNDFSLEETKTQAVYLTEGKYKLAISNFDLEGRFGLEIIYAKSLEKIVPDQNYTIDILSSGQTALYAIDSSYLDEYLFNLNAMHPDLNIAIWDQYGQLLANRLTDEANFYQDYKQSQIYISVSNESLYENIDNIVFNYKKTQKIAPVNIVKNIRLNEQVIEQAKDLPRNINYSLMVEHDSFVSFEFVQNIFEEFVIIGPDGEVISGDTLKVTGQWLIAGQYFVEFKNKIKNTEFKFNVRDMNQFIKLDTNLSTTINLNENHDVQIYHFNMNAESEYYLKLENSSNAAKFKILSQDGFEVVRGSFNSEKIYVPKRELINDYVLIVESTGENLLLDLKLVEIPKVINMSVTDSIDYSEVVPLV